MFLKVLAIVQVFNTIAIFCSRKFDSLFQFFFKFHSFLFRYEVNGGMQDWNYLHTNDFELTLELGCFKYPPHEQVRLSSFKIKNK